MLTLGIDTASDQVSVALGSDEGLRALVEVARRSHHAETLAPAIEFACRHAGVRLDEVGLVAADVGPGRFTGLRVGLAAAKAIAQALGVPMVGVPSLDLLAFTQRHVTRVIVPALDAGKGEVFWAAYRPVPGGVQQVTPPQVGAPDELAAALVAEHEEALCLGDGALRHRAVIASAGAVEIVDVLYPSAGPLVALAHAKGRREEWVEPAELEPIYLRPPDAVINWATRGSGVSGTRS